jgi:hypothetical protein
MMRERIMIHLLVAILAMAAGVARVPAHEGHDHRLLGTVTMAAADHVMLDDTARKPITVQVTKNTRVLRDRKPIKAETIPVGSRVVVVAVMEKNRYIAKTIDVGVVTSGR